MDLLNKLLSLIGLGEESAPVPQQRTQQRKPKASLKAEVIEVVPEYTNLLSGDNGVIELSEIQKRQFAVVEVGEKRVALVMDKQAFNSNQHLTLRSKINGLGYALAIEAKVSTGELLFIYSAGASEASKLAPTKGSAANGGDDGAFSGVENKKRLHYIIENAVLQRATDIHICPRFSYKTGVIMFRVDGSLHVWERMPADDLLDICGYMFTKEAEESSRSEPAFNKNAMQSCSIPIIVKNTHLKLRYQSIRVNDGFDVVLRLLFTDKQSKTASLQDLGYADSQVRDLNLAVRKTVGGIFIAGVTGSGKSTTLKTLMDLSPLKKQRKSYSIEDPVEYKMFGVSQIPVQRSSSDSSGKNAFLEPMKVILRADPDTIMPGEIRDEDSCSMMKGMIQSGHQVMTSIHASSAIEIIERVTSKEFGLPRQSLSSRNFISALVYQKLLPKVCTECCKPAAEIIPAERLDKVKDKFNVDVSLMKASVNDPSCKKCGGKGTYGQTVAAEIIMPDLNFLKLIRDNNDMGAEEYWRSTRISGFGSPDMTGKTSFEHGLYKVLSGVVDLRDLEDAFEPIETYKNIELVDPRANSTEVVPAPAASFINIDLLSENL